MGRRGGHDGLVWVGLGVYEWACGYGFMGLRIMWGGVYVHCVALFCWKEGRGGGIDILSLYHTMFIDCCYRYKVQAIEIHINPHRINNVDFSLDLVFPP